MTLLQQPICEGFAHSVYSPNNYTMTTRENVSKVDQQSDSSEDSSAYVHPKKKYSRQHTSDQQLTPDTFQEEEGFVHKVEEMDAIQSMYSIPKSKDLKLESPFPQKSFRDAQPKGKSTENGLILSTPEYPQSQSRGTALPRFHHLKGRLETVSYSDTESTDRIAYSYNTDKFFARHSTQNWPYSTKTSSKSSKVQMQKQPTSTSISSYTKYSPKSNTFDLKTSTYENSATHIPSHNLDLKQKMTPSPTQGHRQTSWGDITHSIEPSFSKSKSAPDVWVIPSSSSKTNQPLYSHETHVILPVDSTTEGKIKEEIPFVNLESQQNYPHMYSPVSKRKPHDEQRREDTQAGTSVFDMLKDDLNIELSHFDTKSGSSSGQDLDPNECFKYLLSQLPAKDQEKFLYLEKQYNKRQQMMQAALQKDEQQKIKEEEKKIAEAKSLEKMREKMTAKPNLAALLMEAKVNLNPTTNQESDLEQTINLDEVNDHNSDKSTVFRMMAAQHRYRTDNNIRLKQEEGEEKPNERDPYLLDNSTEQSCDNNPINYQINNQQKEHSPYDIDSDLEEQSRHSTQVQASMKTPEVSQHVFQNSDNQKIMPGRYMGVPLESPSSTVEDKSKEMLCSGASSQGSSKKCQICNDTASGFHYGVWSCEGCKAFFKRSLQGPVGYVCPATNTCTIDKHRRKSCQACRLRKCLEMGMTKNTSRKDKGPKAPRMNKRKSSEYSEGFQPESDLLDIKRVKTENGHAPQFLNTSIIPPMKPDIKECPLIDTLLKIDPPVQLSHHSPDNDTEVGINASLMKLADKELVDIINWAKAVPGYVSLTLNDRVHMIESSWMEQLILGLAWRSMPFRGEVLVFSTDMHMDLERIKIAKLQPICGFLKCISVRFCDIKLTREEFVILRGLCLVNAEVSKLESEEKIQAMKEKLIEALHFIIQKDHGGSIKRFGEVMLLLPQIRHCGMNSIAHMFEIKHDEKVPFGNLVQEMLQTRSNPNQAKADEERLSVTM